MDWTERVGRSLKLRDLSVLLTAVEAGSLSKAALQLRVSQPAVSKTIAQLEAELGAQLITRHSRGIAPTDFGAALIARGRAAFRELEQALVDMEEMTDPKSGLLRIAANEVAQSSLVGRVIADIHAHYPQIEFEIIPAFTHAAQVQALQQGRVELVIGQMPHPDLDQKIVAAPLFRDRIVVCAPPQHRWRRRRRLALQDLMDEPWAFSPLHTPSGRTMEQAFRSCGLPLPRIVLIASSMQLLRRMVIEGECLALFPHSVVQSIRDIDVLPVEIEPPWQPIGLLTIPARTLSPLAQLFIDTAHRIVADDRLHPQATEPA